MYVRFGDIWTIKYLKLVQNIPFIVHFEQKILIWICFSGPLALLLTMIHMKEEASDIFVLRTTRWRIMIRKMREAMDMTKLKNLPTLEEFFEQKYGKPGSATRDDFNARAKSWYDAEILKGSRMGLL